MMCSNACNLIDMQKNHVAFTETRRLISSAAPKYGNPYPSSTMGGYLLGVRCGSSTVALPEDDRVLSIALGCVLPESTKLCGHCSKHVPVLALLRLLLRSCNYGIDVDLLVVCIGTHGNPTDVLRDVSILHDCSRHFCVDTAQDLSSDYAVKDGTVHIFL